MIIDILNRWKLNASAVIKYPKFFRTTFSIYRYVLVFGMASYVKYQGKEYHMAFGDYENEPLKALKQKIRHIIDDEKLGMVLIFKSSKNKYHFICPKMLDGFAQSLYISKILGSHKEYLNYSALKGKATLRLTRKHHKEEPKLIGVVFGTEHDKNSMVSEEFVKLMSVNYGLNESNFDIFKIVPAKLEFSSYQTYNL